VVAVKGAAEAARGDDVTDETSEEPAASTPATADKAADLRAIWRGVQRRVKAVGLIVDAADGRVVFQSDPDRVVYPASVAKLFTTAAAVRSLDLDKRPITEVRTVTKGGDTELHLVGSGDPTMVLADWAKLAQAVHHAGVRKVKRLVVDAGVFDDKAPRGFDEKQTDAAYRAPVGGVMCDASTLQVTVSPSEVGKPPRVLVTPDGGPAVVIVNQAKTVAGDKGNVGVSTRANGRTTEIVVRGSMPLKKAAVVSGRRRVADASWFAAGVFLGLLQKAGVEVVGPPVMGKAAAGQVVASHSHHDWRAIVRTTNKQSHNGYAETLFKQVGLVMAGAPSTAEKAAEGVRKALQGLEIHWDGVKIHNGSGLYHADQVSARAVVDLLRGMAKDPKAQEFRQSLAIGGVDGTLRARLKGATQGRVQAKTGTLDDVSGLAGYAEGAGGKHYVFAFFFNDIRGGAGPYRGLQDRMLRRLLAD
jgi:D-alanyl-D-alanine carboxypeptidase/D-alanyl-D-alanine-endopeptidase (penicillin-binding protein 4)